MSKMFLKRKIPLAALCFLVLLLVIPAGCSRTSFPCEYADNPVSQRETLTQVSVINALMEGVYDGVMTFETLHQYGDFGIGTFANLDGEMLGFDGNFYQVKANGIAYAVDDSMETPFACVTFFDVDQEVLLEQGMDYAQFESFLDGILPSTNIFYAIKIKGNFSYVKTRSVPAQQKPYPPLVEVTQNQPTFEFSDVEGTIVGFRSPPYSGGITVPGYHLHFLTEDQRAGGHVLEFTSEDSIAYLDYTRDLLLILPDEDSDFFEVSLDQGSQADLEKVEK
jgi:acetolactate decarboxylase